MARSCCFCGQTVGPRNLKNPISGDFDHVMCGDCASALDCVRAEAQGDPAYRNQAMNYFRQKLDLGLVEPEMKAFLTDTLAGRAAVGEKTKGSVQDAPVQPVAGKTTEPCPTGKISGNTVWIIICRVLVILLCVGILSAGVMIGVPLLKDGANEMIVILNGQQIQASADAIGVTTIVLSFFVSLALLCGGMVKLDKARDLHYLMKNARENSK